VPLRTRVAFEEKLQVRGPARALIEVEAQAAIVTGPKAVVRVK
jgi:hypothetical protein